jgi:hypothetical protein
MDIRYLGRIALGRLGVQLHDVGTVRHCQPGLHRLLLRFQLIQAVAQILRAPPVLDFTDQPLDLTVNLRKLPLRC